MCFSAAPHRDRLNRPHADHDQSTEAKYQRRRQRGFDPFALYRGRIRYQIRHRINQLSIFSYDRKPTGTKLQLRQINTDL